MEKTGLKSTGFRRVALLAAAVLFGACLFDRSESDQKQGLVLPPISYQLDGSTLIVVFNDTVYYCEDGALNFDTHHDSTDLSLSLQGNQATVWWDTSVRNGVAYTFNYILRRNGSAPGIQGSWTLTGTSYTVISGTVDAETQAYFDRKIADYSRYIALYNLVVKIDANLITVYKNQRTADAYVDDWNGRYYDSSELADTDSANYAITVKALDENTVQLRGDSTGETVKLVLADNGDETYTSSDSTHAEYHFYQHVEQHGCAGLGNNNSLPTWWFEFLADNPRSAVTAPMAKAAGGRAGKIPDEFRLFEKTH